MSPASPNHHATRTTTDVDGATVVAWVSGPAPDAPGVPHPEDAARPIVLVHGLGASSRYFRPLTQVLSAHRTVHALDLPGYGSAPKPPHDLGIEGHARAVVEHVRASGLRSPVLVGHSMGAQVVAEALVQAPDLTDRVVLVGPTTDPDARSALRQGWRLLRDGLREPPRANGIILSDYALRCGPPYYLRQVPHLVRYDTEAAVRRTTAQVLVIRGDRDPVVPHTWARRLTDAAPHGLLAEVPGPHIVMMTAPDHVARLVLDPAWSTTAPGT
ncbi:alpha/beta fold hydrolase [Sanguibacter suaedae]|uniref:Alpha/beta fold hydrolase n=1 Tax=Sanguibacter suaedae TaxID=2795737 RepID=A0A934I8T5_9MICO|nr:alpha/beta fold hydrolase [Sanguibacter suaedae]MBI9113511.1 alpha/beta fold hydrolase [Sanguibacter suaedae]